MQFREGVNVLNATGETIGVIDRVVLDPKTRQVSNLVVRKGWFFPEDRVLPVEWVAQGDEQALRLLGNVDLQQLPLFEEHHYIAADEDALRDDALSSTYQAMMAAPLYAYPPYLYGGLMPPLTENMVPPGVSVETERNIPKGDVAVSEGTSVISSGGEHVGDVERVLIDPTSHRVTHIVIAQGLLFQHRKLAPIQWIDTIGEGEVRLLVGSSLLDRLPGWHETSAE
jgi:uncharacterized protein YrrD